MFCCLAGIVSCLHFSAGSGSALEKIVLYVYVGQYIVPVLLNAQSLQITFVKGISHLTHFLIDALPELPGRQSVLGEGSLVDEKRFRRGGDLEKMRTKIITLAYNLEQLFRIFRKRPDSSTNKLTFGFAPTIARLRSSR